MSVLESVKVIDVDTHVVEPYDLWTSRVSTKKWGDRVPHVRWDERAGEDLWFSGDSVIGSGAGAAAAGWREAPPKHAPRLADVDPATWKPAERLRLMDEYGIHAQVLYPNVAGFGAGRFVQASAGDGAFALELVRAYNDFLVEEYAAVDRQRFVPIMAVPFWDLDASIAEMERAAAAGHKGMIFSQAPEYFGQPKLGDPHWDRLWRAAEEMELSVNFHIGGGDMSGVDMLPPSAGPAANWATFPVTFWVTNAKTIAILIGAGVCHRFPRLNFVSVESGVGWLPFLISGLDWMWTECRVVDEHPEYDLLPSEYFKRQVYGCFWFERGELLDTAIELLGADNVLYETDFPHPTSMSPGPASEAVAPKEFIARNLAHLPDDVARKILHDNAARLYHLD
jgi:predicted TIM-barrel fold metal-dependent hydrolase